MATKKFVSLDKLSLYDEKIKGVISAGDDAALTAAKEYANGLATNYDAAGSAATVQGNLDTEIARAKAAEEANAAAAKKAQDEVDALELVVDEIQRNAYDDTELRNLISGLDTNKADKTQVATDIADAVKVEEDARKEAVKGVQDAVDALSGTHATDKAALEAAIALKADQTALDEVASVANAAATQTALQGEIDRAKGEEARIEGLITAEAERAAGVEGGLDERLAEVEAFFKLAEGEKLDTALDTLVELQTYITGEGAAADQMVLDIAANTKAIEDMDKAYKEADGTLQGNIDTLSGTVNGIDGRVTTLEGKMTTVEGAVATKAEKTYVDEQVQALQGADTGLGNRITALENKFGGAEGSVEDLIADAKQEAIDTAAGDATTKAGNAETAAKNHADSLNTAMDARVQALEAIDHDHANKAELDLIASGDKAKWDEAYAKRHEHSNLTVLEGITAAKVTAWDAAEGNAKTYADGLNTAMNTRVEALETWHANFVEVSEEDINNLFA